MLLKKISILFIVIIGLILPNIYSSEHECAAAAAVQRRNQKGIIFVIEGVSGSGKTTMANELMKNLIKSNKFILQSLDENATEDENGSESEEEEASYSSQDREQSQSSESLKFEHSGSEVEEGDDNKTMIDPLQTLSDKGFNVIYDTVISPEYIKTFIDDLKKGGHKVYTIHVFCNPGELAKRTASRNSSAATPDEARSPFQPFAHFPERYTRSTEEDGSPSELLMSPRNELNTVRDVLRQEYTTVTGERTKLRPQEVDRTLNIVCSIGITGEEEEVRLTPTYNYDLVVDNSKPQKAFATVRSFVLEKVEENQ